MIATALAFLGGRGVALLGGALAAVVLLIAVYQTGVSAERKRGEAKRLRDTIAIMERQRDTALAIQTSMAIRLSEFREKSAGLERKTSDLIEKIHSEPAAGACLLSDARRLRLRAIRIGPARSDPRAR